MGTLTIKVTTPIKSVNTQTDGTAAGRTDVAGGEKGRLDKLCSALQEAIRQITQIQQQMFCRQRENIARLAVTIAEKILRREIEKGNYNIADIIEQAVSTCPGPGNIIIRLNPADAKIYQQYLDSEHDDKPADMQIKADSAVGRAECIVETDRGNVEYIMAEHLQRISLAMEGME